MEEIWKSMENHPKFLVSNTGKIMNAYNSRIYRTWTTKKGYETVALCENGKLFCVRVHREVAKVFIQNPLGKSQVNHIDGDKSNNCVSNLEWCTPKENMYHSIKTLGHIPFESWKPYSVPVRCVESGERYVSFSEAANAVDGNAYHISQCCRGIRKTHRKLHWEYASMQD